MEDPNLSNNFKNDLRTILNNEVSEKINEEQYMENVMVWVINPKHAQGIPESSIELEQIGCAYVPHVTGIMKGQNLIIKNSDKTLHNIHSLSEVISSFNFFRRIFNTNLQPL